MLRAASWSAEDAQEFQAFLMKTSKTSKNTVSHFFRLLLLQAEHWQLERSSHRLVEGTRTVLVFRFRFCVNIHDIGCIEFIELLNAMIECEQFPPSQGIIHSEALVKPPTQHQLSVGTEFELPDAQTAQFLLSERRHDSHVDLAVTGADFVDVEA